MASISGTKCSDLQSISPKFSRLRRAENPRATSAGQLNYPPSIEHPRHFPRGRRYPGTQCGRFPTAVRSIPRDAVRSISDRSAVDSDRSAVDFRPQCGRFPPQCGSVLSRSAVLRSANTAQGDRSAVEFPRTATSPSSRAPPSCFEPPSYATGTRYPRENDDFFPTIPFYSDEEGGGRV